jgi:MoxR-like ATPase
MVAKPKTSIRSFSQVLIPYSVSQSLFTCEQYTNQMNQDLKKLMDDCHNIHMSMSVRRYIRDIISATRNHSAVKSGISARSLLDMELVVCALATIYGRQFITPELVMIAAEKVLVHRLKLRSGIWRDSPEEIISDILRSVHPPS